MPKDYAALPFAQVRRRDRAVTDDGWIRTFLHQSPYGTMVTVHEGQPFINSNLFVYDEAAHAIYLHTARAGRTRANIEQEERVCFKVSQMGRLLPADEAEAEHGLQLLLSKYAPHLQPGRDYRPITPKELKRTAVYRINVEQWSGKKKEGASEFPGAFYYREQA